MRCDKQKPCANCVKAKAECVVIPPQPPRRRRKKPQERDLISQLKKYETLLAQNGIKFDPISDELKAGDTQAEDVNDLGQDLSGLKTSPESTGGAADYMREGVEGDEKNLRYMPYFKEYRHTDVPADSSDEEYEGPTIHHAFDTMFGENDGFPFVVGGGPSSITNSHPTAIQIFQLWQIYLNNVNPVLKISHVPTLQNQIIGAGANLAKTPKPLEALMFAIYFMAITSMKDDEVRTTFGEDRSILLSKYQAATTQALVNAGFMRSTELMVLQALFLYLLAIRRYTDPRSLFCLIGVAVRIATRLGLHRDGAQFGISPFDTEQRRRLWWQIVMFDKRIAEMTGSSITALSSSGGDCQVPLNCNDTDLSEHARDPPPAYQGPTEMLFALARIELARAGGHGGRPTPPPAATSTSPARAVAALKQRTRVNFSPSPSSPDVVTQSANLHLPQGNLDGYCHYVEVNYLRHCDEKIPLHYFTLMITRQALCKLRIVDFMCRGVSTESLEQPERDTLFVEAINMVEYDNMIVGHDALQGFMWYMMMNFPFPAYIFLLNELRARRTGDLCDRAWNVIIENHERRGLQHLLKGPLHVAFGSMFLKAWDVREAAEAQNGRELQIPKLINILRQRAKRMPPPKRPAGSSSAPAAGSLPTQASSSQQQSSYIQQEQQQHQYHQQQNLPQHGPGSNASGSSPMPNNGSPNVVGMGVPMGSQPYTPEAPTAPMDMGGNLMFGSDGGFDGSQMFGQDMGMMDSPFNQIGGTLNYDYLMQYSQFGGYSSGPQMGGGGGGGMYNPGGQ